MNISKETIDELNAVLKVQVAKEDYQEKVDKSIKELQRKANMPGFRPGKVPSGVIKKMYGKNVVFDEVNKVAYESITNYIKENNIDILGSPIPNMDKTKIADFETQTEFEFFYDLGLKPQVNIDISKIKVDYYKIKADEELISKRIENIRKSYGNRTTPETSEEEDILIGEFAELTDDGNLKEGGITNKSSVLINKLENKSRKNFIGKKVGDIIIFNPQKAIENETEIGYILGVKKEAAENIKSDFQFTISQVVRYTPAELNQEFFNKILGEGVVTTKEEFKNKIQEGISENLEAESDNKFMHDAIDKLIDEANLSLPDEFLKKFIAATNEKITPTEIEAEYDKYARSVKWQIIENFIIKENNIETKKEDVESYVREFIEKQWKLMKKDMNSEETNTFVNNVMQNKEEVEKIYNKLTDDKFRVLFKEKFKVTTKEISQEEFTKIITEHKH